MRELHCFERERLKGFLRHRPSLADRIIDCYSNEQYELTVVLDDGSEYVYDGLYDTVGKVVKWKQFYDDTGLDWDKNIWHRNFIQHFAKARGARSLADEEVARRAGISRTQMSNYVGGINIPGAYKTYLLSVALECRPSYLMAIEQKYEPYEVNEVLDEDEFKRAFSDRLREAIYSRGLKQAEVRVRADLTPSQLSWYVNGYNLPDAYKIARLAYAIGCPVSELVDF